jgi:hypothetical protein
MQGVWIPGSRASPAPRNDVKVTSELLPALARVRVAIMPSVAEMIAARTAGVTLAGFLRHVALTAMREALVLDCGGGLLGQRAYEHAG